MMHGSLPVLAIFGLVGAVLLGWYLSHPRESLVERRRRKSHNRVAVKTTRPMVKFSARVPKDK